ncbi:putative small secreted protein [Streptomyces sp. SAI-208]|uniref:hypothetical protein n=1 Tax=Streptomyces sp. SAI-208 TaxID=2940550 RepID=UPI002476ED76|nr:hypothetical protein [Streptomyces sp. SAI-208]MDH6608512.1 putative small secreted protein [Streptomyces sp. SAI-208]
MKTRSRAATVAPVALLAAVLAACSSAANSQSGTGSADSSGGRAVSHVHGLRNTLA